MTREAELEQAEDQFFGRVRLYPCVSIVTGQTRMRGHVDRDTFETHSRYTHVYVPAAGGWRLVSAQGTRIASAG
jgi:hypothetical protein